MPASNPYDELTLPVDASSEEIDRAYRREVVKRHRRGVRSIVARLAKAQHAFRELSDASAREHHRREALRKRALRADEHSARQAKALDLLLGYKRRMNADAERIAQANRDSPCYDLEALERELDEAERAVQAIQLRDRRRALIARLLLAILMAAALIAILSRS